MNKKALVVQQALQALERTSGLEVSYDDEGGSLRITAPQTSASFRVLAQPQVAVTDVARLIHNVEGREHVVVASRLGSEQRSLLRGAGINYLDSAGNAWLSAEGLIVFIDGQMSGENLYPVDPTGRAFEAAGLRVLFALLINPEHVKATYRDLASQTGVSLATVKYVFDDLEQRGNVIKIGQGRGMQRRMTGTADLAKHWAETYRDRLRPKLLRGRFRFLDPDLEHQWKMLQLDEVTTCWGGEPAADLYDRKLRAEQLTLYTAATTTDLAQALRIVPDPAGPVEVLDRFWTADVPVVEGHPVAPRLLAYADLLASGITRNLEAAPPLFDAWIHATIDTE